MTKHAELWNPLADDSHPAGWISSDAITLSNLIRQGIQPTPLIVCAGGTSSRCAADGLWTVDLRARHRQLIINEERGEVEIVDLLNIYKSKKQLSADLIGRGGAWLDTGSIDDFYKTSAFVSAIENRQGFKIACLEEISLNKKWTTKSHINESIKFYGNCEYSNYLKKLIN